MRSLRRTHAGRPVEDRPLPGDEAMVVELQTRWSILRDNRFNPEELAVYLCVSSRLYHGFCIMIDCPSCGGWH